MLSVGSVDRSQQEARVKCELKNFQVICYDSKSQVLCKYVYPPAKRIPSFLEQECKHPPRFQLDAAKLDQLCPPNSFDLIFLPFLIPNQDPHSVQSNQRLLRCFLRSASKVLKPDGEIQIILKNGERYERWNLPALLDKDAGLQLQSSHPLDKIMFPGYTHRFTNGMQGAIKEVPDRKELESTYLAAREQTYWKILDHCPIPSTHRMDGR